MPSQRCSGSRPIRRPTPKVALAASSVPAAEQAKPSSGTERDDGRADQRQDRHRDDAADDECGEHERHAPRAACQAFDAGDDALVRGRRDRRPSGSSRTTASNAAAAAPSSARPHFTSGRGSRRPVAWATSSSAETTRSGSPSCTTRSMPADSSRSIGSTVRNAGARAARRHGVSRGCLAPWAVLNTGTRGNERERVAIGSADASAAATLFSSLPQCSAIKRLRTDAIAAPLRRIRRFDGEVALGVEAHRAVIQVRRADAQERARPRPAPSRARGSTASRRERCSRVSGSASEQRASGATNRMRLASVRCRELRHELLPSDAHRPCFEPAARLARRDHDGFERRLGAHPRDERLARRLRRDVLVLDVDEPLGARDGGDCRALDLADLVDRALRARRPCA